MQRAAHPDAGRGPMGQVSARLVGRVAAALLALLARGDLLLLLLLRLGVLLLHALLVDEHARTASDRGAEQRVVAARGVADEPTRGAADEAALLVRAERVRGERRR